MTHSHNTSPARAPKSPVPVKAVAKPAAALRVVVDGKGAAVAATVVDCLAIELVAAALTAAVDVAGPLVAATMPLDEDPGTTLEATSGAATELAEAAAIADDWDDLDEDCTDATLLAEACTDESDTAAALDTAAAAPTPPWKIVATAAFRLSPSVGRATFPLTSQTPGV